MSRFKGWRTNQIPRMEGTGPDVTKPLLVGIDPDVDQSGVAWINKKTGERELFTLSFWDLVEFISRNRDQMRMVVIEAGHLNPKSNFRDKSQVEAALKEHNPVLALASAKRVGENIALKVGRNHEIGILIADFCRRGGIPFLCVQPTASKITSTRMFYKMHGIKTAPKEQEIRDAFQLIAGL